MKLLYDVTVFINGHGKSAARSGIYFTAYNILLQLLKNRNFEISLYCRSDKELYQNICNNLYPQYSLEVLDDKADFSHFETFFSPVFATPPILKNKTYLTKFFILYDAIPLLKPEYFNLGAAWFFELLQDINNTSYYFTISDYTKKDFIKYIPTIEAQNMTTIPLAANDIFYPCSDERKIEYTKKKYKIPLNKKYILSLCTLEPRKNLIRALHAFISFISTNNITDTIYVLGGGHWPGFLDEIKKQIPEYRKYDKNIIFPIGYVDDEDLSALYSGAEFFVYTSLYEGFGLPPLEAMQCGTPVITSNVTSMPEVVGNAALLIDPMSLEDHIQAFKKFYYNPALKEEYTIKGITQAQKFNWEKCAQIISNTILKNTYSPKPDITIITPLISDKSYKIENIIRCIESVRQQNYSGNIEHIIVSNSTSSTLDTLKNYQEKGWVQILQQSSSEQYIALNNGIKAAHGQYITFLHANNFYHNVNGLSLSVSAIHHSKKECCSTDVLIEKSLKQTKWSGGFSRLPEGFYPCLDGILISHNVLRKNDFGFSPPQHTVPKFLLNLASEITYTHSEHCFITYENPDGAALPYQIDSYENGFLFYQYVGSKINLSLADCIFMTQKVKADILTSYQCLDNILSKLSNRDWIHNLLKKYEISSESIPERLVPIRNKDIFRYIKYKICSYIYISKRNYYRKKFKILSKSLKRLN